MSPFINGNRFVYVSPDVSPPLPKEAVIAGHSCRIWHPSQKNFCKRCSSHGHRTIDVDLCESFEADCVVTAFRADRNPLSNYYLCTITHADTSYKSVVHYYQREFCLHCGREDVAQQVSDTNTPRQAKKLVTKLKTEVHQDYLASWTRIKVSVMERALKLKWNSCSRYRQTLMSTEGMVIAEATKDDFWGVGVAPNLAEHTKPSKFLGLNQLGRLHMTLRGIVSERESQNSSCDFDVSTSNIISITTEEPSSSDFSTPQLNPSQTLTVNAKPTSSPRDSPESISNIIPVTVSHEQLNRVDHPSYLQLVTTPDRPPRKPKVKRSDTRSTGKHVNTLDYLLTYPLHPNVGHKATNS